MTLVDIEFMAKCQRQDLSEDTLTAFKLLTRLNASLNITQDIGSFYMHGYITAEQGEVLEKQIKSDIAQLEKFSVALVNHFQPPESLMDCMIAPGDGEVYKHINHRI